MNEPLITLSWIWGLDLKWVEEERVGISLASAVHQSEIHTSGCLLTVELHAVVPPISEFASVVKNCKVFVRPSKVFSSSCLL